MRGHTERSCAMSDRGRVTNLPSLFRTILVLVVKVRHLRNSLVPGNLEQWVILEQASFPEVVVINSNHSNNFSPSNGAEIYEALVLCFLTSHGWPVLSYSFEACFF